MNTLFMTVGLPRAGKSTWARKQGFPIVNPDSIRLALHGQAFVKEAETMVWTIAKYMVKSLFLAGHDKVILDATNLTFRRRAEWISSDWMIHCEIFNTPKEECILRAIESGRDDLIPVIENMSKAMEFPKK